MLKDNSILLKPIIIDLAIQFIGYDNTVQVIAGIWQHDVYHSVKGTMAKTTKIVKKKKSCIRLELSWADFELSRSEHNRTEMR